MNPQTISDSAKPKESSDSEDVGELVKDYRNEVTTEALMEQQEVVKIFLQKIGKVREVFPLQTLKNLQLEKNTLTVQ